jgi:feruloyl esterase
MRMRGLKAAIANVARLRGQWERITAAAAGAMAEGVGTPPVETPLRPVARFGANPGQLQMFTYVPETLAPSPGLVVVLHGCTQNAAGYDHGSGWSALAERHGFVVVYPQQSQANNQKTCFNWFQPGDIARDAGEALSIRQMVEHAAREHGVDRRRIFVTGLSAGGAMTAVMLATYPEVFAAGAIIAGLPYGGALNVQQALESMFKGHSRSAAELGDLVRRASAHRGPWPRLSVWHGSADAVVKPGNADELVRQWTNLHDLPAEPTAHDTVEGHARAVWRDPEGRAVLESITVAGMGHGTPLAVGTGEGQGGAAGPFMLDVGLSSTHHIAEFWGLTTTRARDGVAIVAPDGTVNFPAARQRPSRSGADRATGSKAQPVAAEGPLDVGATITKALKAAGLMR